MTIRVDDKLQGSLAAKARGRIVLIDAFRSWNCGTWVGDVTARFADAAPGAEYVAADPIEGVPVMVRATLPKLLDDAGASLHGGGLLTRDGLRVQLDKPELWLDWLANPGG
ncbi:MAG: hypothetical protein U0838_02680 [Chloroflexota bacterium]